MRKFLGREFLGSFKEECIMMRKLNIKLAKQLESTKLS